MEAQAEPIEKRIVLDELRRALDKLYEASDALDNKIQQLLAYTSLIATIYGSLQLSKLNMGEGALFLIIALMLTLAIYLVVFLIAFDALRPRTREFPISGDWAVLHQDYIGEGENRVLDRMIHDYIESSTEITKTNSEKSRSIRTLMLMMGALIVVVLLAVMISVVAVPCVYQTP